MRSVSLISIASEIFSSQGLSKIFYYVGEVR